MILRWQYIAEDGQTAHGEGRDAQEQGGPHSKLNPTYAAERVWGWQLKTPPASYLLLDGTQVGQDHAKAHGHDEH